MNLNTVAKHLELLEETVIYRCLDRVQFAFHPALYQTRQMTGQQPKQQTGQDIEIILQHSLLGLRLQAHETMEQDFGRYSVAEEFPFSPAIAKQIESDNAKPLIASQVILQKIARLQQLDRQQGQTSNDSPSEADLPLSLPEIRQISQCRDILQYYLQFLARYCPQTNDIQYGSAFEHDVMVLQAISRRVHYGAIYVAEIKYREQEALLRPLIEQWQQSHSDTAQELQQHITAMITRSEVEQRILQRVYDKAEAIQLPVFQPGAGVAAHSLQRHYLAPHSLRELYADCVIPLTKQGELAYLYRRV